LRRNVRISEGRRGEGKKEKRGNLTPRQPDAPNQAVLAPVEEKRRRERTFFTGRGGKKKTNLSPLLSNADVLNGKRGKKGEPDGFLCSLPRGEGKEGEKHPDVCV